MKLETLLWAGVTAYFVVIATLYALVGGSVEGIVVLTASAAFGGLVAGWSWRWSRHNPLRASDVDGGSDVGADSDDVGAFPSSSLRPLGLAVGMCMVVAGVALGSWMSTAGVAMVASQVALIVRDTDG